jgi:carboxymethylenebutenolidase
MPETTVEPLKIEDSNVQAGPLQAYLARPAGGENLPGVIIIHEIYGLNDNMRDIARRFAREGYIALAVDLFSHGNRAMCMLRVIFDMLKNPLQSLSMSDLDSSVRLLKDQAGIDPEQIGVIGFCMGGGYALAFAVHNDELRAASIFYGRNPNPLESLERACPVLGSYGEKDRFFAKQGRRLEQTMQKFGRPVDVKIYPNATHSFFNDTGRAYQPEAAADSWQRTLEWFKQYLPQKA